MTERDWSVLDALEERHPDLRALVEQEATVDLARGATPLARRLVGARSGTEHWVVTLLDELAPSDMGLLEDMCRLDPLKAVSATVAILNHLAPRFVPQEDRRRSPRDQGGRRWWEPPSGDGSCSNPGLGTPRPEGPPGRGSGQVPGTGSPLPPDVPLPPGFTFEEASSPREARQELARHLAMPGAADEAVAGVADSNTLMEQLGPLMPNMGWDMSRSHLQRALLQDLERLALLLRRAPTLRRIATELGRLEGRRRLERRAERGGRESVVGVRVGRELADVLPGELAMLGDTVTEDLFYQRYTEHRLLCLELEGNTQHQAEEGERRGPVVACVDTSGSMQGMPEAVAKALILATVRMVLPQGRQVRLMLFGGPGDFQDMDLRRGPQGLEALLSFLTMSFHAGTDYDGPLARALELLHTDAYHRADVLVVTDGYCQASPAMIQRLEEARVHNPFRVVSVVVGGPIQSVEAFSDQVWRLEPGQDDLPDARQWQQAFGP